VKFCVTRKLILPAVAVGAILAGASPALAATSSPAASATASSTSAVHAPAAPDEGPWTEYQPPTDSPSRKACQGIGTALHVATYKCLEYEFDGYTTVWDLWFRIIS
jgi:hypothetical protein